jgi:thiamine kinase-like enzyme
MSEIERALGRGDGGWLTPCHNDLLNGNFMLDEAGQIRILDWEYAGMGDPFFDLANFSAHHEFGDAEDQVLVDAYLACAPVSLTRTLSREARATWSLERLHLYKFASDMREAMWGVLQQGVSELDYDFRGYAARFFDRAARRMDGLTRSLFQLPNP